MPYTMFVYKYNMHVISKTYIVILTKIVRAIDYNDYKLFQ